MNKAKQQQQEKDVFAANAGASDQKSWGEKYGTGIFDFTRDFVINYVINFIIGAVSAYKYETSNFGREFNAKIARVSAKSTIIPPKAAEYALRLMSRNQLLLVGGHILLPVLKVMKDHQQKLTFEIGHTLDQLQEVTGNGNRDSKRALSEYERTKQLLESKKNDGALQLSSDDKTMLARKHINDKLEFKETKQSWWNIIKARLIGMTCSTAASGVLGVLSDQSRFPLLQYEPRYEIPFGKWAAKNVVTKTPILRTYFGAEPERFGRYFLADAILTIFSAGTYKIVETFDEKTEREKKTKASSEEPAKQINQAHMKGLVASEEMRQLVS